MNSKYLTFLGRIALKFGYFKIEKHGSQMLVYPRYLHPFSIILIPVFIVMGTISQGLKYSIEDIKRIHVIW